MAPIKPHWAQPSHPDVQKVITTASSSPDEFATWSVSAVTLPPFAHYADFSFPPCTLVSTADYSTVQAGRDKHIMLNSDLLYINHSCEPSLIFDTDSMKVIAGPRGIQEGEELSFFYPSTEWSMAQPFQCACGKATCRGIISGAGQMPLDKLQGIWLASHIRELLEEKHGRDACVDLISGQQVLKGGAEGGLQSEKLGEAMGRYLAGGKNLTVELGQS